MSKTAALHIHQSIENTKDKRYSRAQQLLQNLFCLSHSEFVSMLQKRPDYYEGQQWSEHIFQFLLPGEEFDDTNNNIEGPKWGWGIDLGSSDSLKFHEIGQLVASDTVLVYWPLVMHLIQKTLLTERMLSILLSNPDIRFIVHLYLIPDVFQLRQRTFFC